MSNPIKMYEYLESLKGIREEDKKPPSNPFPEIVIRFPVKCKRCGGSGEIPFPVRAKLIDCPDCRGSGWVEEKVYGN